MFCQNCGSLLPDNSPSCRHCGFFVRPVHASPPRDPLLASLAPEHGKSWLVTLGLALLLPFTGVHRFYTGHIGTGVLQFLTAGGFGIWHIIDVVRIALDNFRDEHGVKLVR